MPKVNFKEAKRFILEILDQRLSPKLTYHGIHHTLDVYETATNHCKRLNLPREECLLVKTASLCHDIGFVFCYGKNHEIEGVNFAMQTLGNFGYNTSQINQIGSMIMCTQIPQKPQNLLEKIIADADLDYLGREDFWDIGESLFTELQLYNIIHNRTNWNEIQVKFLEHHSFHLPHTLETREEMKLNYLHQIRQWLIQNKPARKVSI